MATAVLMPELGEGVDEATITQWLKQVGEEVREFDPIVEVNTDKVDTEIPSPVSGTVLKIMASPDQIVQAGETLAWIGEAGESIPDIGPEYGSAGVSEPVEPPPASLEEVLAVPAAPVDLHIRPGKHPDFGYISPVVARIASEHNVDLSAVEGTGKDGRKTKVDLLDYVSANPIGQPLVVTSPSASLAAPQPPAIPGEVVKLSTMRKMIADHMVMSKDTSPHVTTVMEADLSKVVGHRVVNKSIFARDNVNLTYTDISYRQSHMP